MEHLIQLSFPAGSDEIESEVDRLVWLSDCGGSVSDERDGRVVTTLFFSGTESRDVAAATARSIPGVEVSTIDREETDWLEHYQQSLEPILIGERFVVTPDPTLLGETERIPIVVPQERAFGTGSHESTALCLELLETLDFRGTSCLDFGTGSGILAIAMALLGADRVVAFDNDLSGWGVLSRNLERNGTRAGVLQQFFGSIEAMRRFEADVAAVNIIPEVTLPMLPEITRSVRRGGDVVLSGILAERKDEVVSAVSGHEMSLVAARSRGEWWAAVFRKA